MRFRDFDAETQRLVYGASQEDLDRFARDTMARVTRPSAVAQIPENELDSKAWAAFRDACAQALDSTPEWLRSRLATIDAGVAYEDDVDKQLLVILGALEYWADYLEDRHARHVVKILEGSIIQIDYEVEADIDDFLAHPEMAREYARIREALTPADTP